MCNTIPYGTEASSVGTSGRACVARAVSLERGGMGERMGVNFMVTQPRAAGIPSGAGALPTDRVLGEMAGQGKHRFSYFWHRKSKFSLFGEKRIIGLLHVAKSSL